LRNAFLPPGSGGGKNDKQEKSEKIMQMEKPW